MVKSIPESPLTNQVGSSAYFLEQYQRVRRFTEHLCEPLVTEDYVIQSMPDVSPTKWHIAHVSWFFETFLLFPAVPGYQSLHPQYAYLFNSYYNTLGERHCRPKRGLISRPTASTSMSMSLSCWRISTRGGWQSSRPSLHLGFIMNSNIKS